MFKFLKRRAAAKPDAKPVTGTRPTAKRVDGWTQPSPLDWPAPPEVDESDDELVWDQWEHSQMELDSRMGPLSVYDSVRVKEPSPSQFADDPFDAVRRKRKT
jgi:hypothetical protein